MEPKRFFQQNGRFLMPQQQQQSMLLRGPHLYKKPYKGPLVDSSYNQSIIFNPSQIPDNYGYVDFNNPSPPIMTANVVASQEDNSGAGREKKKNNRSKSKQQKLLNSQQQQGHRNNNGGSWNKKSPQRLKSGALQRSLNLGSFGSLRNRRSGTLLLRGALPPPMHGGFQAPGLHPPLVSPMAMGHQIPPLGVPLPHFLRRNGRSGGDLMPPIPPPPMSPIMPPPMRIPRAPPMPFTGTLGGKVKKTIPKLINRVFKGKSTIKTLKNMINQYPLDKPWVTDEIKAEYQEKLDLENRLKGNKNDELFAQFKKQHDKFVSMYETARGQYLKQEAEAIKAFKDAKNKETNDTQTAEHDRK